MLNELNNSARDVGDVSHVRRGHGHATEILHKVHCDSICKSVGIIIYDYFFFSPKKIFRNVVSSTVDGVEFG